MALSQSPLQTDVLCRVVFLHVIQQLYYRSYWLVLEMCGAVGHVQLPHDTHLPDSSAFHTAVCLLLETMYVL